MEFCKILKPDQVDKIACISADGKWENLASIRKRTKADIVINGPIFNMSTYKIYSKFVCNYKQCGSGTDSWGLRFDDGYPPQWSWGGTGAQNFISEFGLLVVDGKIRNSVSASPKAKRGRTAIGVTPAGEFVIYVVLDTAKRSEKKTAKELAEKMLALGCKYAINLDGGGSSQISDKTGIHTAGRNVPGFVCVWLKENSREGDDLRVIANAKINTYDAEGKKESGRYIDKCDICTVKRTINDNLLIEIEYPVSNGVRTAYIKSLEHFKVV